jgi:hypothetical protein
MTRKTTKTRAEAKRLMWEYYSGNKDWLPNWIREFREEILNRLVEGYTPDETFRKVIIEVEDAVA